MWTLPILILVTAIAVSIPLSRYMAWIMDGRYRAPRFLRWFESRLDSGPQDWKQYTVALLVFNVWPFAALVLTRGVTQGLNLMAAGLLMTMYALIAKVAGTRPWLAVLYPLAATILAYIVASATVRTVARGGIEWRGTFYPLAALEKNML